MDNLTPTADNGRTSTTTADRMRAWARGDYPVEAGVELLIRSGLAGRADVAAAWPADGGPDTGALTRALQGNGTLSGGQRRLALIALSLLNGEECENVDLSDVLTGLDRDALDLVLAALAHAGGSHQHSDVRLDDNGQLIGIGSGYLPPLHPWPPIPSTH